MRVGVFGGSFNPIHNGHIGLAKWFVDKDFVDEVWLMVSPQNPLKNFAGLQSEEERLYLAQLATEGVEGVRASDFEFSLPRPSYTWRTLMELKRAYPNETFSLIIGADNWTLFSKWKNYLQILESFRILIYPRENYQVEHESLPDSVTYVSNAPQYPYSSTEIRESLQAGGDVADKIPLEVLNEIRNKRLFL